MHQSNYIVQTTRDVTNALNTANNIKWFGIDVAMHMKELSKRYFIVISRSGPLAVNKGQMQAIKLYVWNR